MPEHAPSRTLVRWYLAALGIATVVVYASFFRYFFAQDDFVLLERGAFHPIDAITRHFAHGAGQFRPLTKGVYFALAYRVFGLDAFGYHAASLAVHVLNVLLTFALLRRLRVGVYGALTGATLFALSSAHFTTIAWATCIQQLLAMSFMLGSMVLAVDADASGRARPLWRSLLAYALALACIEQAALLPVVTTLMVTLGLHGADKDGVRRSFALLRWHWLLMGVYIAFLLGWKTLPASGLYHPTMGTNVFLNAWTDLARTMHFFVVLPIFENVPEAVLYKVNTLLALLVVYHLARRRWREVVFALAFFVATALPVLGLVRHAFYYQTYVIGFGVLVLIGLAVDDAYALLRRTPVARAALLAVSLVACTVTARVYVHRNETAIFGTSYYLRNFVIRRAGIAREVYDGVMAEKSPDPSRVVMFYGRMEHAEEAKWNVTNVRTALGTASAFRLFYDNPDLDVRYVIATDSVQVSDLAGADVFMYSDFGHVTHMETPTFAPGDALR